MLAARRGKGWPMALSGDDLLATGVNRDELIRNGEGWRFTRREVVPDA